MENCVKLYDKQFKDVFEDRDVDFTNDIVSDKLRFQKILEETCNPNYQNF